MNNDWKKREAAAKRAKLIKARLLSDATGAVERLWAADVPLDSGFTAAERKAIADASHSIRSIVGKWAGGARR